MTISSEEKLQSLVKKAEERERIARRRAVIYSLVPIALAVLLIAFTYWQVEKKAQELVSVHNKLSEAEKKVAILKDKAERYRTEMTKLQERVDELNKTLEKVTDQLRQATSFSKYKFQGHVGLAMKLLYSRYPKQGRILGEILTMQNLNVRWKLGGISPQEGFDSPSFAAYVLVKQRILRGPPSAARYRLRELLPSRNAPQIGGIVFYELGYAMFYFKDERGRPFVIGMTPLGILALKADFAPIVGYAEVRYR